MLIMSDNNLISYIPEDDRYRFEVILYKYYRSLTTSDIKFMDMDDFLRFIPNNTYERGMAGLLWKRYLRPTDEQT